MVFQISLYQDGHALTLIMDHWKLCIRTSTVKLFIVWVLHKLEWTTQDRSRPEWWAWRCRATASSATRSTRRRGWSRTESRCASTSATSAGKPSRRSVATSPKSVASSPWKVHPTSVTNQIGPIKIDKVKIQFGLYWVLVRYEDFYLGVSRDQFPYE